MQTNIFTQLERSYLIAEAGVNHNGDLAMARELVLSAKRCGADAIKVQTFTAKKLVTKSTPKVPYQERTTTTQESHYEMISRLELGEREHRDLAALCLEQGIDFLSTQIGRAHV